MVTSAYYGDLQSHARTNDHRTDVPAHDPTSLEVAVAVVGLTRTSYLCKQVDSLSSAPSPISLTSVRTNELTSWWILVSIGLDLTAWRRGTRTRLAETVYSS